MQQGQFEIQELQRKIDKTKINHILHIILSLLTFGIWIIVWIIITIISVIKRENYEEDLKEIYEFLEDEQYE